VGAGLIGTPGELVLGAQLSSLPPVPRHVRHVEEIKARLDRILALYDRAEEWGDAQEIRRGAELWIGNVYAHVIGGATPQKRRRLALMFRIDRLASLAGDPFSDAYMGGVTAGAYDGITDADLAPVLKVWRDGPGAKAGPGRVSKWLALHRVLSKHWGDETATSTLDGEYREAKRGTKRNRKQRKKRAPLPGVS
jgi:hypothetical protein